MQVLRRSIFPLQLLLNELDTTVVYNVATANNAFTLEYVRLVAQVEGGQNCKLFFKLMSI